MIPGKIKIKFSFLPHNKEQGIIPLKYACPIALGYDPHKAYINRQSRDIHTSMHGYMQ